MDTRVPAAIQPLIDAYLHELEPLNEHFYGIYLFGSIALDAFEEQASDIDIIVLTQGEWSPAELTQLAAIHAKLMKMRPFGERLEAIYVPFEALGKSNREIAPYPKVHEKHFSPAAYGSLNGVTWWILRHNAISLAGPDRSELAFAYTWEQVLQTMRYNLDVYFAGKLKRPYIYLSAVAVEFAITNLCRILTTIEDREIISKSASLKVWRERLPTRWQRLLDEAWRIRHQLPQRSLYRTRLQRMRETVAFIEYVRERGDKGLIALSI